MYGELYGELVGKLRQAGCALFGRQVAQNLGTNQRNILRVDGTLSAGLHL